MPLFSVIIPLYNKENYIRETIASVLQQTCTDFELLVIDDASTDNSVSVVETMQDPRIRIIHNEKNMGLSATRNVGIASAEGNIIALLDADDIWLPTFLSAVKNLYESFPKAAIFGTDYIEKYQGQTALEPQKSIPKSLKGLFFALPDFFQASMQQPIFCQSSLAFKRSLYDGTPVFNTDITFAEDIDFYIRYGSKYEVAYHYEALAEVRFDVPQQMSRGNIASKTLPDLDSYEDLAEKNSSLQKYLDLYRYIFASLYTFENEPELRNRMLQQLNPENLTFKQRLLLKSPRFMLVFLKRIKRFLLKNNIRITSF